MILVVSTYRERLHEMIAAPKQVLAQSPLFLSSLIGLETMFHRLYKLPDIGIALLFGMVVPACLLECRFCEKNCCVSKCQAMSLRLQASL